MPDASTDENTILVEARRLTDPVERAAFLDRCCGADADLRRRIEQALTADVTVDDHRESLTASFPTDPGGTLTSPPDATDAFAPDRPTATYPGTASAASVRHPELGQVIAGRYSLQAIIGEGGMGSVFRASQSEPVKRLVALKLIKTGMDSRNVLARFEAERQALALMDHPNIARIYDGGVTDRGQPFFVMELVYGFPLTEYCDSKRLSVPERLALFVAVCQAVQHAHQKGIIHRDLKPGNVLVTEVDGRPTPKVIDFGVAKATEQKLTDMSFADTGAIVGTPAYMSPEQADPTTVDIDTRSDVYSLGVILYELLTGAPPIDAKQFRRGAVLEMLRMVREVDPPRPSTKLSTADALPNIASNRSIEPARLAKLLQGELDWVVMKALEKDRSRRYETANGLARDVQRYLADEVVEARPPSRGYRLRKFVKRNKGQVLAASLVTLALIGGMIGTSIGLVRANRATERERFAKDQAVDAQKAEAQRARELQQVADFQASVIDQIDPTDAGIKLTDDVLKKYEARLVKDKVPEAERATRRNAFRAQWLLVNATDTARDLIDRTILKPTAASIDAEFRDQPLVAAQLRQTIANRYTSLKLFGPALPLQEQALAARRQLLGDDHPETIRSIMFMGVMLQENSRIKEAEPYYYEALERSRRVLGEDHLHTISTIANVGYLLDSQGKYEAAEPYQREALEKNRRIRGEEHRNTLLSMGTLATLLRNRGQYAEAERLYREVWEKRSRLFGKDHPDTISIKLSLGMLLNLVDRNAEAEPLILEASEQRRKVLGEEHPQTLTAQRAAIRLLSKQGKLVEAEMQLRDLLMRQRRVSSPDSLGTIMTLMDLCSNLGLQNRPADATPFHEEAVERYQRVLGPDHALTLIALSWLGENRFLLNRSEDAIRILDPLIPKMRKEFTGDNLYRIAYALRFLGAARTTVAKTTAEFSLAEANLLEARELYVKNDGENRGTIHTTHLLIVLYQTWDRAEPGRGHADKAASWQSKVPTSKEPAKP